MHYPPPSLPSLFEIERLLEAQPHTATQLKISVLRNITIEGIEPYLRYLAAAIGCRAEVAFGGHDQILQDAISPPLGLLEPNTGVVLVISVLPTLSPVLDTGFAGLTAGDVEAELERLEEYFKAAIGAFARVPTRRSSGMASSRPPTLPWVSPTISWRGRRPPCSR